MHSNLTWDWLFDVQAGDGDNDGDNEVYASVVIGPLLGLNQYRWNGATWDFVSMGHGGEWGVDLGDGDNDGLEEVYAAFQYFPNPEYELHKFDWDGISWVSTRVNSGLDYHALGLAVGDGNNDGENEVYTTTYSGGIYQYKWINDSWQRTLVYDEGHELTRVAVGDGDNNGTTEIYVADYGDPGPPPTGGHVFMYEWDGIAWIRTDIGEISIGTEIGSVNDVAVGDVDGDGDQEVYCSMGSHVFMCSIVETAVTVTLTPYNPPIQIPATGGSFDFNVVIANNGATALTFDGWIMANLPTGVQYLVLEPVNLTLPGGASIDRDRAQYVPANAPPGTYTYEAYVGIFPDTIWDSDSFSFEKMGTGDGLQESGWANWGETFDKKLTLNQTVPDRFACFGAFPNPFNVTTTLSFSLPEASRMSLKVFDVSGCHLVTLVGGWRDAGFYQVTFDGSNLTSGIYFYKLKAGELMTSGKLVLIK